MILREELKMKDGALISRKGLGRLPSYDRKLTKGEIRELKRINKFLNSVQTRIQTLIRNNRIKEAQRLSEKLLRKSKAFHVYIANRSTKGGYWKLPQDKGMSEFNKFRVAARNLKSELDVYRYYILKADGKRKRPIGAPSHGSKMYYLALEVLLREFLEPKIGNYQHGFMRGRGTQSASLDLINKIKGKSQVYQFDLDGCFNRINYRLICGRINSMGRGMGNLLLNITLRTFPKITEYHPEKEIFVVDGNYVKRGFTQGSPLSPLLSIWAMEFARMGEISGLVMYADDGIIVQDYDDSVESQLLTASQKVGGIMLAEDKGNGGVSKFSFLGLDYDLIKQTVSGEGRVIKFEDTEGVKRIIKYSKYSKTTPSKGNITEGSLLGNKYTFMEVLKDTLNKEGWGGLRKVYNIGHKIIFNRNIDEFIDIQSESTKCCLGIIRNANNINNWRSRKLPLGNYKGGDIVKKGNAGIVGKNKGYGTNETGASLKDNPISTGKLHYKSKK